MPAFHIWTLGCQMNRADSLKLAAGLERLGYSEAGDDGASDLIVINTCSVRQHAEDRAYSRLGVLRKRRERGEQFKLAVMGCMVGPKTDELERRFPWVDAWARPQEFDPIIELAGRSDLGRDVSEGEFWTETFGVPEGVTAFVPVVHGCDKFCTFCIVPFRRGRERSRPVAEVLAEVRHLAAHGVREVTLLGQTVEAYGRDLDSDGQAGERPDGRADLATLFEAIERIDGIVRTRFLTSYPRDMTDRIIGAVADLPKVCEHFNLPVQSGDDTVLERMRRGYTLAEYEERVQRIRGRMPHAAIATDVIVGFPGETDEQFANTIALLERLQFDVIHAAAYSERPGTYATRNQPDDVPLEVKKARLQAVEAVHADSASRINRRLIGERVEVLVEREEDGRSTGRTRGGQLVHFAETGLVGELAEVIVDSVTPWSLQGRAADDVALAVV
ncbi:MAG: tRNA (N6-isopentenyl adenosine(37)-C2)-methylthiotransferase MiaB [Dehalococcoidia bacterium]|nr:tRNA (N6-isopentenyl adenosine(37)-C2)-methylthiotransferase MiaB [Dehalococcoidia bacterium]